ncbi:hypothetical protein [Streptomyces sp. ML-6]|uniref:hypothetical protein n=1 Tax=Streptomyces sp. ML-6 TaxID=2982693 RepID=UPI0024BF2D83|nr:hypothetical protein [Streptomyces sp. ML-6]MDK0517520.1 hypothetical protein [Streptomyces sp. ML-6]MDK0524030.1 hypothetical protein [Streptomyces sp. ML-6]MDK0524804.1 hypothetical protein [Streptomyces sp. ML-6]
MRFVVQADRQSPSDEGPQEAILVPVAGDDHGYQTSYDLWFRDENRQIQRLGRVKIALGAQEPGPSPLPVGQFEHLDSLRRPELFSLGQDDLYYDSIRKLGTQVRLEILIGLGDIALSSKRLDFALQYDVTALSLLRSVEKRTVMAQFKRIASGGSRLTEYRFNYLVPAPDSDVPPPPPLSFVVTPRTTPSSNIHVLIGRNGVGKTTLLRNMAQAAVHPDRADVNAGRIEHLPTPTAEDGEPFVNVVSVTFSAFDPFVSVVGDPDHAATTYAYVGLASAGNNLGEPKSHEQLGSEFASCLKEVWAAGRLGRWVHALRILSSDPHFAASPSMTSLDASVSSRHRHSRRAIKRQPEGSLANSVQATRSCC